MITAFLLTILADLVGVIISPFQLAPDVTLSPDLTNAITNVQGFITTVNPIFPVTTLLIVLGVVLSVELALLAYKAMMWGIRKIPGIS